MTTIDPDELREWLRENLVVDVTFSNKFEPDRDVYIGLRFKGEAETFTRQLISIPEST